MITECCGLAGGTMVRHVILILAMSVTTHFVLSLLSASHFVLGTMSGEHSRKARQSREKFRRRKLSLLWKARQLADICSADVYIVIRRRSQVGKAFFAYNSTTSPNFPPSREYLV